MCVLKVLLYLESTLPKPPNYGQYYVCKKYCFPQLARSQKWKNWKVKQSLTTAKES